MVTESGKQQRAARKVAADPLRTTRNVTLTRREAAALDYFGNRGRSRAAVIRELIDAEKLAALVAKFEAWRVDEGLPPIAP